jgi:hypothetical protein
MVLTTIVVPVLMGVFVLLLEWLEARLLDVAPQWDAETVVPAIDRSVRGCRDGHWPDVGAAPDGSASIRAGEEPVSPARGEVRPSSRVKP